MYFRNRITLTILIGFSLRLVAWSNPWFQNVQKSEVQESRTALQQVVGDQKEPVAPIKPGKYIDNKPVGDAKKDLINSPQAAIVMPQANTKIAANATLVTQDKPEVQAKVENNIISVRNYFFGPDGGDFRATIHLTERKDQSVYTYIGDPRSITGAARQELKNLYANTAKQEREEAKVSNATKLFDILDGKESGNVTVTLTLGSNNSKILLLEKTEFPSDIKPTTVELARGFVLNNYIPPDRQADLVKAVGSGNSNVFVFSGEAYDLSDNAKDVLLNNIDRNKVDQKQIDPKVIVTDAKSTVETRLVKVLKYDQPGKIELTIKVDPKTQNVAIELNSVSIAPPVPSRPSSENKPPTKTELKNEAQKFAGNEMKLTKIPMDRGYAILFPKSPAKPGDLNQAKIELKHTIVSLGNLLDKPAISPALKKQGTKVLEAASLSLVKTGDLKKLQGIHGDVSDLYKTFFKAFEDWYLRK